jgi:D-glycero-D-manno-heptose 1,7-bisphosphate phosphatase
MPVSSNTELDKERKMNVAAFLDRDGTIVKDNPYEPNCTSPMDVELLPGAAHGIRMLNKAGFKVIVVTNQPWIAEGYITEADLEKIHDKMIEDLEVESAVLDDIYYCPHGRSEGCECRKPKTKLIYEAQQEHDIYLPSSFVVGDRLVDIMMGKNAGCHTVLVGNNASKKDEHPDADFFAPSLLQAAQLITTHYWGGETRDGRL